MHKCENHIVMLYLCITKMFGNFLENRFVMSIGIFRQYLLYAFNNSDHYKIHLLVIAITFVLYLTK